MLQTLTAQIFFTRGWTPLFRDTITLYNFFHGVWHRHIIQSVDVGAVDASSKSATTGDARSSRLNILINCSSDKKVATSEGPRQYYPPKEYERLESPIESNAITFCEGKDFIVLGAVWSEDPVNDENYENGYYDHLYQTRDGVYMITSAAFFSLIPHFEIGAR